MITTRGIKDFVNSDSGVAYGFYVIAVFLITGTVMYVMIVESSVQTTEIINDLIGQGLVSQKTANTYSGQMALINYTPIFMLIGVFLWGIVRALEKKRTEG